MTELEQTLLELRLHGWSVLERVIPEEEIASVRESVVNSLYCKTGTTRVKSAAMLNFINHNQAVAPYLSDERIVGPMRAIFGPHIRLRSGKAFVEVPGTERSALHADGPFIQTHPVRITAPYQDAVFQFTTIWMFSRFTAENGGTVLVPGSHRSSNNRTGGVESPIPYPGEVQATGPEGSVLLFDNRLWHTNGRNCSNESRIGALFLYFPWWLCQDQNRPPQTPERQRLLEETGLNDKDIGPGTELVPREVFDSLPEPTQPLLRHWVDT